MKITNVGLKFGTNYDTQSIKNLNKIILHHSAGTGSVQDVHSYHKSLGWAGIGYHFYVRQDGTIYQGRPVTMVGAHTVGYNTNSLGVCAEGNFEKNKMSSAQKSALKWLVAYLKNKYGISTVKRHKDYDATACPGKYYPYEEIKSATIKKENTMTNKEIQTYLNKIGLNCGTVDGIIGIKTKAAIRRFQTAQGISVDGIAGPVTQGRMQKKETVDWSKIKYFKKSEFHCQCGKYCKGSNYYPAPLDAKLIKLLDQLREWLGKPITVTSGLRCYYHNANVGGVSDSKHQTGHAADITWDGINSSSKQKVINKAYALGADYSYTNDSSMAGAVHIDVAR